MVDKVDYAEGVREAFKAGDIPLEQQVEELLKMYNEAMNVVFILMQQQVAHTFNK